MTTDVINIALPPYNAAGDNGVTDDLPVFEAAIADLGASGGVITGPARKYRIHGTLNIQTQVALDFRCNANGGDGAGAILYGTADAPILRYSGQSRFARLNGLSIVGNGAGSAQHGIVVENGGIWLSDSTIRACGGHGLFAINSYVGSYRNLYVSLCGGDGVRIENCAGANLWQQICAAANGGNGLHIDGIDGADVFFSLVTEQNACYGTRIDGAAKHCQAWGVFSEGNGLGPIRFDALSEENAWHFTSCGYSEPMSPADYRGGLRNAWDGHCYGQVLRHMFSGVVGVGIDAPADALDVAGALAISGWRALSYDNVTLRMGSVVSPGWSGVEIWTLGTRKGWW